MKWKVLTLVIGSLFCIRPGMAQETKVDDPKSSTQWVVFLQLPNSEKSPIRLEVAQENSSPTFNPLHRPKDDEEPFKPEKLPLKEATTLQEESVYRGSPGISILTPSGYGLYWRQVGIGVGYQQRTRFTNEDDGVIGIGFGLGDPKQYVGLQVGIALVDVSDPFADGTVSFKLHRRLPENFSIALGVQGAASWGVTDGGSSLYGVVTKRFVLQESISEPLSEIYVSVGVGGGQFRPESDIINGVESVGVFGSLALRLAQPAIFITEWSGQDLTIGISLVPFRNIPLVITPAVTDVTGTAGDGARFILGTGLTFSF